MIGVEATLEQGELNHISDSLLSFKKLLDPFLKAYASYLTGYYNLLLGDYPNSKENFESALELCRDVLPEGHPFLSFISYRLGRVLWLTGEYDKAQNVLNSHFHTIGSPDSIVEKATTAGILFELGNIALIRADLETGYKLHLQAYQLRIQVGNPKDIASSLNNIATCLSSLGRIQDSLKYLEKSLEIREKLGNDHDISATVNNLAVAYNEVGKLDEALLMLERVLTHHRNTGHAQNVAKVLSNISQVYIDLGLYTKAQETQTEAFVLRKEVMNREDIAESIFILGRICLNQNTPVCKKLMNQFPKPPYETPLIGAYKAMLEAMMHFQKENWVRSTHYFSKALEVKGMEFSKRLFCLDMLSEIEVAQYRQTSNREAVSRIYQRIGDYEQLCKTNQLAGYYIKALMLRARFNRTLADILITETEQILEKASHLADENNLQIHKKLVLAEGESFNEFKMMKSSSHATIDDFRNYLVSINGMLGKQYLESETDTASD